MSCWGGSWGGAWGGAWGAVASTGGGETDPDEPETAASTGVSGIEISPLDYDEDITIEIT